MLQLYNFLQQYPNTSVRKVSFGAILGPVDKIDHPHYHCSPILTRPKDNDKRRVILNLSHPRGASVNDNVTRDKFDDTPFALRFRTNDNIVNEIRNVKTESYLK